MRAKLALPVVTLVLALSGAASAQEYNLPTTPPANPQKVVPDQQLENVDQRLQFAADRLQQAAEKGDQQRLDLAFRDGRDAIQEVRKVFGDLPQERRTPYEEAVLKAEQVLQGKDARAGAAAIRTLQQRVRDITARGA